MKLKRLIAILLALSCLLSLGACGKKNKNEETTAQTTEATTEATTETTAETTTEKTSFDLGSLIPDSDVISSVLDEVGVEDILSDYGFDLSAIGGELGFVAGSVESVLALGFETDADLDATLRPGEVSPAITVSANKIVADICVANPYDKDIAVKEGVIASCTIYDKAATIIGGFACGKATVEEVTGKLGVPYETTDDSIVYKVHGGKLWELGDIGELYTGFSADSNKNWELIFVFSGGVLSSVELRDPALSHGGLEDNLEPEELETITYEEQVEVAEVRKSILEELTAAFAENQIEVAVDEKTGEIVLLDNILFGNESYTLSEEGKAYLDSVFGIYARVLLEGEYSDRVSAIVFEGHTNTLGTFDYNQDLSEKRADAVLTHCLESEANGLDDGLKTELSEIARTVGRSYTDPVYTSDGEVDMEASRRVELRFLLSVAGN